MTSIQHFDLNVVGMHYRLSEEDIKLIENEIVETGEFSCKLDPEPTNIHDEYAVRVLGDSPKLKRHIGYIARPVNVPLFRLLKVSSVRECLLREIDPSTGSGTLSLKVLVRN